MYFINQSVERADFSRWDQYCGKCCLFSQCWLPLTSLFILLICLLHHFMQPSLAYFLLSHINNWFHFFWHVLGLQPLPTPWYKSLDMSHYMLCYACLNSTWRCLQVYPPKNCRGLLQTFVSPSMELISPLPGNVTVLFWGTPLFQLQNHHN